MTVLKYSKARFVDFTQRTEMSPTQLESHSVTILSHSARGKNENVLLIFLEMFPLSSPKGCKFVLLTEVAPGGSLKAMAFKRVKVRNTRTAFRSQNHHDHTIS